MGGRGGWHHWKHGGGFSGGGGFWGGGGGGMPGSRKLSSADLELLLLALLERKPAHGYELIRAVEEQSGGFYTPSPGVIYPALTFLAEIGYAAAEPEGNRKLYRITDSGRAHLEGHRGTAVAILEGLRRIGGRMEQVREAFAGVTDADPAASEDLHQARHALKSALYGKRGCDAAEARRLAAILRRATAEILTPSSLNDDGATVPASQPDRPDLGDRMTDTPRHQIGRMRFDTRRRTLTVTSVAHLTPKMLRVVLTSPELADFDSRGADDHIKLFFSGPDGQPLMRDYTPRAFSQADRTLTLDFALHDAGPATAWALGAKVGDTLEIGGPRGSMIVPDDFDWYLLVADETGLPAIGRRLEELRPGVPVHTVVAVDSAAEIQAIETKARWTAHWVTRDSHGTDDAATLRRAVEGIQLPPGDGYVWIAAEATVAKALRAYVLEDRKHPAQWMRASGYWLRGEAGAHENL
ncbi:NADPH-dependent ferric siderophore reductase [Nitrospirillum amazonense]|uniref:NADPH-dependent ferric siderophore reductase n=2 Tax=Nitrospirillum amazonense TaxID=28077 RepID=A0A560K9U5_9PROT|nr:NADPH-dependent ferric siderophore reductase [Nitrospirillum amazonense]